MRANATGRRIVDAFRRARRLRLKALPASSDRITLAEAATTLRLAQRGTDLDLISRGLTESDESLLAFWAHCVVKNGVPVYGCRIMPIQPEPEVIPDMEMQTGRFINHASRLDPGRGNPVQDFCDLQVSRIDLEACLTRIVDKAA